MVYYEMAIFLNEEGKSSSDMKRLSAKMKLLYFKQNGIKKVRWIASTGARTCKKCESLNGQIFLMDEALEKIPLLVKDCKNIDDGCRCCWGPVVEL
jgi:SPP1 gp7 family putative phage head morphogenesis protein